MNRTVITLAAFALLISAGSVRAAPSFDGCEYDIVSLPAVLSSPGVWCLRTSKATAITGGTAITVATNGVTLDCNGFRVSGLGAGTATTTVGIRSTNKLNTTIRNCIVRGFHTGIRIDGGGGAVVEDNRIEASTVTGIALDSDAAIARDNFITDTGGSTVGPTGAQGITVYSPAQVIGNTVSGVVPVYEGTNGFGILVSGAPFTSVTRNRVTGIAKVTSGDAVGIRLSLSAGSVAEENHVLGGSTCCTAISCTDNASAAVRNVTAGYGIGVSSCLLSGNVNLAPQ